MTTPADIDRQLHELGEAIDKLILDKRGLEAAHAQALFTLLNRTDALRGLVSYCQTVGMADALGVLKDAERALDETGEHSPAGGGEPT